MGRHVQLGKREKKLRFLEEICAAFEKVMPNAIEYLTKVIDDNRKKLRSASGFSPSGRYRFSTSLPTAFIRFVEIQARKRGICGPDEYFFNDYKNIQLLFQVWPDLKIGRGQKKFTVDMKGIS